MNTATQTTRLESGKVRLIDANALIEEMKDLMDNDNEDDEWNKPLKFALKLINSAPTVETTDDVLARLPNGTTLQKSYKVVDWPDYLASSEMERWLWETPLEAVTRLEASLNQK